MPRNVIVWPGPWLLLVALCILILPLLTAFLGPELFGAGAVGSWLAGLVLGLALMAGVQR